MPLYVVLSKANSVSAGVCQYVDMYYSHVAKPFFVFGVEKKVWPHKTRCVWYIREYFLYGIHGTICSPPGKLNSSSIQWPGYTI